MNKIRTTPRIASLDISRGLAIVFMIEAHILIFIPYLQDYCGTLAAPFFFIIAGASYQLFLKSRIKKGLSKTAIYLETFWRALLLFLVTISISIGGMVLFAWYYSSIGVTSLPWTVFEIIAIGYVLGLLIYRNFKLQMLAIFLIFSLSYVIAQFHVSSLYFLVNQYPLDLSMNMICYFIFGQMVWNIYDGRNISSSYNNRWLGLSGLLIVGSLGILQIFPVEFTSVERATFQLFLLISGVLLLLMLVLIRVVDIQDRFKKVLSPIEGIGRIAFSAFYLNVAVIFVLKKIVVVGPVPPLAANLIILVLTVIILAVIERIWKRFNYFLSLEWLLRQGANIMTKHSKNLLIKTNVKNYVNKSAGKEN